MKKIYLLVTTILLVLPLTANCYTPESGNLSLYGGPFSYKTNFEGSSSGAQSPIMGGLGLVVLGDINQNSSLEIGTFFLNKVYFRNEQQNYIAEQTKLAHITMGYRRWFSEKLSASLTFFSAYSMGELQVNHSDFIAGTEINTSARDITEYGFDLAFQSEVYQFQNYAIILDARYSFSLTKKENESADHYGLLVGFQYQLQDKNPNGNLK